MQQHLQANRKSITFIEKQSDSLISAVKIY